ncbi:MAG: hypothetical protein ACFB10_24330 [Salibacteraceae bacterium]
MKPSNEPHFHHYMDLVVDQHLWGAFRKINHLQDVAIEYLAWKKLQMKFYPMHDSELEMQLALLRWELLQVL